MWLPGCSDLLTTAEYFKYMFDYCRATDSCGTQGLCYPKGSLCKWNQGSQREATIAQLQYSATSSPFSSHFWCTSCWWKRTQLKDIILSQHQLFSMESALWLNLSFNQNACACYMLAVIYSPARFFIITTFPDAGKLFDLSLTVVLSVDAS